MIIWLGPAATVDTARGRIETRTLRVLPAPDGLGFPHAQPAVLIERGVTVDEPCMTGRNRKETAALPETEQFFGSIS
jgi:hypothetical protein